MMVTPEVSRIPPLESGDHLSRAEFERRYAAMPQVKAELIEGVVYMASPLRVRGHGEPHSHIVGLLWTYKLAHPNVVLAIEPTVRLDERNEVQPDAVLFVPGRQAVISADDFIEGPPELVVEIAASSASIDLHEKKQAYARNGVREYLVWRTLEQELDWFVGEAGTYQRQKPDAQGVLKSRVFPGLWLDVAALLQGNLSQALNVLHMGLRA